MIKKCRHSTVDLVKFQLFSKEYAKANKIPEFLSLAYGDAKELFEYGKSIEQEVFFTPFDILRVDWCKWIGTKYIKVRHADCYNPWLMKKIIEEVNLGTFEWFNSLTEEAGDYIYKLENVFRKYKIDHRGRMQGGDIPQLNELMVVPKYPANISEYLWDCPDENMFAIGAISDHTPDLKLVKIAKILDMRVVEKHVKLHQDCLETKWSVFIDELGEVINGANIL